MKAILKVDPRRLPASPYPPTRTVRTIEKPDRPYEAMDYASDFSVDAEKMSARRKRAAESTARTLNNGYTLEQEALIIELYKQGMPTESIANRLGRTKVAMKQKIEKLRKTYGFEREAPLQRQYIKRKPESEITRRGAYTPAQNAVIIEMRMANKSWQEIADNLGRSRDSVRKHARMIV